MRKSRRILTSAAAMSIALVSPAASALVAYLDQLLVVRDGATFLNDTFDDGLPPPNTPGFNCSVAPNCYALSGSFPAGSEAGGKLRFDTAFGDPSTDAAGNPRVTVMARLLSNRSDDPVDINSGLKIHRIFSASALYDMVIPGPGDAVQLRLSDSHANSADPGHQNNYLQLQIRRSTTAGASPQVRLIEQSFAPGGGISVIDTAPLDTSLDADQIRLKLTHPVADSPEIFASWEYLKAGAVIGNGSFPTPGTIFDGETWTRVDVIVSTVPEPESYAMMLIGAGLVGWRLRRSRRALALS